MRMWYTNHIAMRLLIWSSWRNTGCGCRGAMCRAQSVCGAGAECAQRATPPAPTPTDPGARITHTPGSENTKEYKTVFKNQSKYYTGHTIILKRVTPGGFQLVELVKKKIELVDRMQILYYLIWKQNLILTDDSFMVMLLRNEALTNHPNLLFNLHKRVFCVCKKQLINLYKNKYYISFLNLFFIC